MRNARNFANPELILPLTIAQIDLLIDLGAKLNEPNQQTTPLQFAIASKSPELVKLLIENGADVNLTSQRWINTIRICQTPQCK